MTEIRDQYQHLKEQILNLLEEYSKFLPKLKTACPQLGDNCLRNTMQIEEHRKQIMENIFTISVIGEMKNGKSTLLNAMLGKLVFPKDVSEATAAIAFLRHNERAKDAAWHDKAVVSFADTNRPDEIVEHSELRDYATRLGDKLDVAKEVSGISVYTDSKFVENGVEVVDTPGINTTFSKHAELTDEQIRKSNAAIFLFCAGTPGKKTDYDFLRDAAQSINKFFFVVNRIDEAGGFGSELAERAVNDIKKKMHSCEGLEDMDMSRFYQTAGLLALLARSGYQENEKYTKEEWDELDKPSFREGLLKKSGLPELENDLLNFLLKGDRMAQFFASHLTFLKNCIEESRKELSDQCDALEGRTDLQELETKMQALEIECERQRSKISENADKINEKLVETLDGFIEEAGKTMEIEKGKFEEELKEYQDYDSLSDEWETISRRPQKIALSLSNRLTSLLQKRIFSTFTALDTRLRGQLNESLRKNGLLTLPDVTGTFTPVEIRTVSPEQESKEEIDRLRQVLADCEKKLQNADETELKYQALQADKTALEMQLRNAEARMERNMELLGSRPDVKLIRHPAHTETHHCGWFDGAIFPHTETIEIPERIEKDDSAGARYDAERRSIEQQFKEKTESLDKQLEEKRGLYTQAQIDKARMENIRKLENAKRKELEEAKERMRQKLADSKAVLFKKNKTMLLNSLEEVLDAIQNDMTGIVTRCSEWAQNYITQIQAEVDDFMRSKKDELESLKNTLSLKQEEKAKAKQTLDEAEQALEEVSTMFDDVKKENDVIYNREV